MRIQLDRTFYIPKGAIQINDDPTIFTYTASNGKPAACAFVGKAVKPTWKYYFNTEAQRQVKIDETISNENARQARKADAAASRKAFRHTLAIGDVLRSSWGYDQTNVDYYQVTALKGSTQVVTRRIAGLSVSGDSGRTGRSGPDVGAFLDRYQPETFKVQEGNCIRVASYARAYLVPMQQVGGLKVYETAEWTAYA